VDKWNGTDSCASPANRIKTRKFFPSEVKKKKKTTSTTTTTTTMSVFFLYFYLSLVRVVYHAPCAIEFPFIM
jgi:hypothetical protein